MLILILGLAAAMLTVNLLYNLQRTPVTPGDSAVAGPVVFPDRMEPSLQALLAYFFALTIAGVAVFFYVVWGPRRLAVWQVVPVIVFLLIIIGFAVLVTPSEEGLGEEVEEGATGEEPTPERGGEPTTVNLFFLTIPGNLLPFLVVGLLAAALIGAYLLLAQARTRALQESPEEEPPDDVEVDSAMVAQGLASTLERGLYRLELGDDVRSAVLGFYRDMLDLFRSHGIHGSKFLTAREVELSALERLGLSSGASKDLRQLFELARYSSYPLTDRDRQHAMDAIRGVREELGG